MNWRNIIPNTFTSLNLVFGSLAIIEIFEGRLENVIYYTMLSGVMDFFDGFLARKLHAQSNIGKDLDSLADMVSFGVVPALVMYQLLQRSTSSDYLSYAAVLIVVMSGLRLAKFNNDERQTDQFFGMPTPANAFLICSFAYLTQTGSTFEFLSQTLFLLTATLVTSLLLVVDIPMMAFKFKQFGWEGNEEKYIFLIVTALAIFTLHWLAIPLIIIFYVLESIVVYFIAGKDKHI